MKTKSTLTIVFVMRESKPDDKITLSKSVEDYPSSPGLLNAMADDLEALGYNFLASKFKEVASYAVDISSSARYLLTFGCVKAVQTQVEYLP